MSNAQILTREQLKAITGGNGSGSGWTDCSDGQACTDVCYSIGSRESPTTSGDYGNCNSVQGTWSSGTGSAECHNYCCGGSASGNWCG